MRLLKKIGRSLTSGGKPAPTGKSGARAYAVGDIHGRADLLDEMLALIDADRARREQRETFIIFLGDLVDRGPDSAAVVERLRNYRPEGATTVFLAGNHEEMMLRALRGERKVLRTWLRYGGIECATSYGVDAEPLRRVDEEEAVDLIRARVPESHIAFLESFRDTFHFGGYLFVHAGIRPGVTMDEQTHTDLRWIREPFLSHSREHGFVVVHGHTITEQVQERPNRIGIDTGAYHSGVLTALAVEDSERWYLTATVGAAGIDRPEALPLSA